MEFRDLKTQYQRNKEEIDSAMQNVLLNANFIGGKDVGELETMLADYVGVDYCISCANGTEAMSLVLMAWGVGKGDAVFYQILLFFLLERLFLLLEQHRFLLMLTEQLLILIHKNLSKQFKKQFRKVNWLSKQLFQLIYSVSPLIIT